MLHADWLSPVFVSASLMQPEAASQPPAAPGGTPNVAGLPAGAQGGGAATGQSADQTAGGPGVTGQPTSAPLPAAQGNPMSILWMVGGMMVLMILIQVFAGRGERKRRAAMMSNLGKGDKVLMTGGVIGTVSELSDSDLVVRVEEGKIRFSKSAVQQVLESSKN
ncbi:MAG TPA: preprotein translocase subunit YajC [Phycisphaerales bacterium]|nr:preprotein translocase subunit YajC [Phycisphaerales bacterium]